MRHCQRFAAATLLSARMTRGRSGSLSFTVWLSHRHLHAGSSRRTPKSFPQKSGAMPRLHDSRVHYLRMKNITLSADEQLIEQARLLAKSRHKTLNAMFREWLEQLTAQSGGTQEFDALMKRLKHVQAGRSFSREEMNER
jgi:hypothetical protein